MITQVAADNMHVFIIFLMTPAKKRLTAILLMVGPFVLLPIVLMVYAMTSFMFANGGGSSDLATVIGNIVSMVLGLAGMLCVLGIFVGIPLGIYFLVQAGKEEVAANPHKTFDPRSGKGDISEVPPEITGWSWGGFGLGWIWGVFNNVWWSLLQFVGPLGLPIAIYLGFKGRELAWKHKAWESVEAYKRSQKEWDKWGLIVFVVGCAGLALMTFMMVLAVLSQ